MGFSHMDWIMSTKVVPTSPIPQADACFTDVSPEAVGGIHDPDIHQFTNIFFSSAQLVELPTLFHLLQLIHKT